MPERHLNGWNAAALVLSYTALHFVVSGIIVVVGILTLESMGKGTEGIFLVSAFANPGLMQVFYAPLLMWKAKAANETTRLKWMVILSSILFLVNGSCLAMMLLPQ